MTSQWKLLMPNSNQTNKRIAVIGLPGAWSSEVLAQHIEKKTGFGQVIPADKILFDLVNNKAIYQGENLLEYDGLVIKHLGKVYSPTTIDRLSLLTWLSSFGVKMFSAPNEIARLVNRLDCTLALQSAKIPMPPTCITENIEEVLSFIQANNEVVLKPLFSTKARGMLVVHKKDEHQAQTLATYKAEFGMMYVQKKIPIPGKDLGLMFMGGEYKGCYARNAASDSWNTTINSGGHYSEYRPRPETIALAKRAQALFDLSFTTVDVVETDNNDDTIIFEVSAFGGFKGAKEGLGIDIAEQYADYILERV